MNLALFKENDGHHVGPLFIPRIIRPAVRPQGKQGMVHRAQTRRATPAWADKAEIERFYVMARKMTELTGELYVVDHIVPKISDRVCGLHVGINLQVIHWLENAKKGSLWWPDMWYEQMELI